MNLLRRCAFLSSENSFSPFVLDFLHLLEFLQYISLQIPIHGWGHFQFQEGMLSGAATIIRQTLPTLHGSSALSLTILISNLLFITLLLVPTTHKSSLSRVLAMEMKILRLPALNALLFDLIEHNQKPLPVLGLATFIILSFTVNYFQRNIEINFTETKFNLNSRLYLARILAFFVDLLLLLVHLLASERYTFLLLASLLWAQFVLSYKQIQLDDSDPKNLQQCLLFANMMSSFVTVAFLLLQIDEKDFLISQLVLCVPAYRIGALPNKFLPDYRRSSFIDKQQAKFLNLQEYRRQQIKDQLRGLPNSIKNLSEEVFLSLVIFNYESTYSYTWFLLLIKRYQECHPDKTIYFSVMIEELLKRAKLSFQRRQYESARINDLHDLLLRDKVQKQLLQTLIEEQLKFYSNFFHPINNIYHVLDELVDVGATIKSIKPQIAKAIKKLSEPNLSITDARIAFFYYSYILQDQDSAGLYYQKAILKSARESNLLEKNLLLSKACLLEISLLNQQGKIYGHSGSTDFLFFYSNQSALAPLSHIQQLVPDPFLKSQGKGLQDKNGELEEDGLQHYDAILRYWQRTGAQVAHTVESKYNDIVMLLYLSRREEDEVGAEAEAEAAQEVLNGGSLGSSIARKKCLTTNKAKQLLQLNGSSYKPSKQHNQEATSRARSDTNNVHGFLLKFKLGKYLKFLTLFSILYVVAMFMGMIIIFFVLGYNHSVMRQYIIYFGNPSLLSKIYHTGLNFGLIQQVKGQITYSDYMRNQQNKQVDYLEEQVQLSITQLQQILVQMEQGGYGATGIIRSRGVSKQMSTFSELILLIGDQIYNMVREGKLRESSQFFIENLQTISQLCDELVGTFGRFINDFVAIIKLQWFLVTILGIFGLIVPQSFYTYCWYQQEKLIFGIVQIHTRLSYKDLLEILEVKRAQLRLLLGSDQNNGYEHEQHLSTTQPAQLQFKGLAYDQIKSRKINIKAKIALGVFFYVVVFGVFINGNQLFVINSDQYASVQSIFTEYIKLKLNFELLISQVLLFKTWPAFSDLIKQGVYVEQLAEFERVQAVYRDQGTKMLKEVLKSEILDADDKAELLRFFQSDFCENLGDQLAFCDESFDESRYGKPEEIDNNRWLFRQGILGMLSAMEQLIKSGLNQELQGQLDRTPQQSLQSKEFNNIVLQYQSSAELCLNYGYQIQKEILVTMVEYHQMRMQVYCIAAMGGYGLLFGVIQSIVVIRNKRQFVNLKESLCMMPSEHLLERHNLQQLRIMNQA